MTEPLKQCPCGGYTVKLVNGLCRVCFDQQSGKVLSASEPANTAAASADPIS